MWRCFSFTHPIGKDPDIFSTYVEVFLPKCLRASKPFDFLHVCGGVSPSINVRRSVFKFSPRMWRCFQNAFDAHLDACIFSTYVEVFLLGALKTSIRRHFLHVCGGVSRRKAICIFTILFSPRMWRCFLITLLKVLGKVIFSTYVEVFLCASDARLFCAYFLHVCGGVSIKLDALK